MTHQRLEPLSDKDVLLVVDVQNDFLPGGALAVASGDEVIEVINQLIPKFKLVMATQDWHPRDHQSFASEHPTKEVGELINLEGLDQILWPDHCVQGTHGAAFAADLALPSSASIFKKGIDRDVDSYSGFYDNGRLRSTGLAEYLTSISAQRVFVAGLATDYCVKFTVLDSIKDGFETWLITDGCRAVQLRDLDEQNAIDEMVAAGAKTLNSNDVVDGFRKPVQVGDDC